MKILFISKGDNPDYQSDALLHGLKSLYGPDVVDVNRVWYMYSDSFGEGKAQLSNLYGRGFSLFGLLPSDVDVDRTDIEAKIASRFYDLIIYGSVHRCAGLFSHVIAAYPKNKIVLVDGEDHPGVMVQEWGLYFKRELFRPMKGVYGIEFAIPKEKIRATEPEKKQFMAPYDPILANGYAYETEAEYYQQYADSYFGTTMKKAGWCCMRHYEQLANWCIPYFRCLEACPATIMEQLPREELMLAKQLIEYNCEAGFKTATQLWGNVIGKVMNITREHLTTEALGNRVISTVNACA